MASRWAVAAVAAVLVLGGCGTDDGTGVRTIDGGGGSVPGSGSGSGAGAVPAPESETAGAGSGSAAAAACTPVGDAATADTMVAVALAEWSVTPDPTSVPAGVISFAATNGGAEVHELVVVQFDDAEQLPVVDGQVDEAGLPAGALIGEIEGFPAGESCQGTFALASGNYALFCNIVETGPDGTLESHFEEGMRTAFTVA